MMELSKKQSMQLDQLVSRRGSSPISREELISESMALYGREGCFAWISRMAEKTGRGVYDLSSLLGGGSPAVQPVAAAVAVANNAVPSLQIVEARAGRVKVADSVREDNQFVPSVDNNYVSHDNCKLLEPILKSNLFYPVFITGLSGNGKTTMVQQVCAKLGRELFRANITIETDEDDLLGGFRLVNGDTVWQDGPVIEAMMRGAVLLLDEVDLASNKIMCLQSVLEGKSIFLKKLGRIVEPAKGFTVIATANTKGKGDNSGGFVGTNVLNEAFLDRFPITIYQDYPSDKQEIKILKLVQKSIGATDEKFIPKLVTWAASIRKSYEEEAVTEIITTRRLINIVQAQAIFNDRKQAIALCIERFDDETKKMFMDFYEALDDGSDSEQPTEPAVEVVKEQNDVLVW